MTCGSRHPNCLERDGLAYDRGFRAACVLFLGEEWCREHLDGNPPASWADILLEAR